MVRRMVAQIQALSYEDIVFIMGAGILVVGLMVGLALLLTRKLPNPHDR